MNRTADTRKKQTALNRSETRSPKMRVLLSSLEAAGITAAASIALILACAGVLNELPDPDAAVIPVSHAVLTLTSFACGYIAAKLSGSDGLMCGVISGAILLIAMSIAGAIVKTESASLASSIMMMASVPVLSALGGLAGRKNLERKPARHRKK